MIKFLYFPIFAYTELISMPKNMNISFRIETKCIFITIWTVEKNIIVKSNIQECDPVISNFSTG